MLLSHSFKIFYFRLCLVSNLKIGNLRGVRIESHGAIKYLALIVIHRDVDT